ncbi:sensor histidine kinase [Arenibaculum pallidiluteum]|uniref:sensor histidine kinase n=1 Tax=Arenibaculum pallidiluteum TaxID=2812559 RepID=UPI001A978D54|nr:HAMP domain-containing sensor histidine kinase [Arenibaculum pallidiluteum]
MRLSAPPAGRSNAEASTAARRKPARAARNALSLPRIFAAAGGIVFACGLVAFVAMHDYWAVGQLRAQAENSNIALAHALSNILQADLRAYTRRSTEGAVGPAALDALVRKAVQQTSIVKVKIYDDLGLTIYSSDPSQIGEDKGANAGFRQAVQGRPASALTFRNEFDAFEGAVSDRDIVSSYVPVRLYPHGDAVSHVFEIYSDVTPFKRLTRWNLLVQSGITALTLLLMYLLALVIVTTGSRVVRRQNESMLRLTADIARAEAASEAKSSFLMQVSHELRTPLHGIIGFAEVMRDAGAQSKAPAASPDYAEDIIMSARGLLELVNDVLDYVRAESGADAPDMAATDLARLVRGLLPALEAAALRKGLRLTVDIAPDLAPVETDGRMLRVALSKLIENAVKFTSPGGEVTLAIRPGSEDGVEITLCDDGPGISPADLPRCLSAFGQADTSATRRHGGLGLGLPLASRLVERLGGTFGIESAPGAGTRVSIRLPHRAAPTAPATDRHADAFDAAVRRLTAAH